jgi:DnaK suppressor protein
MPGILHIESAQTGTHVAVARGMTHPRHAELRQMLQARRDAIEGHLQRNIQAFRDSAVAGMTRPPADLSDDPVHEDLAFALVEMQVQTLKNITAALVRLRAGDYGICHECEEEIPEKRLRALPFATTCLSCQGSAEDSQLRGRRAGRHRADLGRRSMMETAGF